MAWTFDRLSLATHLVLTTPIPLSPGDNSHGSVAVFCLSLSLSPHSLVAALLSAVAVSVHSVRLPPASCNGLDISFFSLVVLPRPLSRYSRSA